MSVERVIGVDFGTSTSVIRVKRYQNGMPIGDPLFAQPVTFNMGNTMVPTLIQRAGHETYYGFEAQVPHKKSKLFQNFKVDLENQNPEIRQQARELTAEFLKYLFGMYQNQREHLGEMDDLERTIISYPVKWSNETKQFMISAMKRAGFPNVEGMDEAQAAIQTITVQNSDYLSQQGYFQNGVPVNILLIDMGAGTTDLVLCRHTPGGRKTQIICTWPIGGDVLFGGTEVDLLLQEFIKSKLPPENAETVMKRCGVEKIKAWKETVVSPSLKKQEPVCEFNEIDMITDLLGITMEDYALDRESFETMAGDYLRKLALLVNGCLQNAGLKGRDIDLVILTGGHSQWYFVKDILSGKTPYGTENLEKITQDSGRIIPIALPQETVALGLVFSQIDMSSEVLTHIKAVTPSCTESGNIEYWLRENDRKCFLDSLGEKQFDYVATIIPALGHSYVWQDRGDKQVRICKRCGAISSERNAGAAIAGTVKTEKTDNTPTPENEFRIGVSVNNLSECLITKYIGTSRNVVVPESIKGYRVCAIGENAFSPARTLLGNVKHNLGIKKINTVCSVVIPKTVKQIQNKAFYGCFDLEEVVLHEDIEHIGREAFAGCPNLKKLDFGCGYGGEQIVYFPKALKRIGVMAFSTGDYEYGFKCEFKKAYISKRTAVDKPTILDKINCPGIGCPQTFDGCELTYYEQM